MTPTQRPALALPMALACGGSLIIEGLRTENAPFAVLIATVLVALSVGGRLYPRGIQRPRAVAAIMLAVAAALGIADALHPSPWVKDVSGIVAAFASVLLLSWTEEI